MVRTESLEMKKQTNSNSNNLRFQLTGRRGVESSAAADDNNNEEDTPYTFVHIYSKSQAVARAVTMASFLGFASSHAVSRSTRRSATKVDEPLKFGILGAASIA